MKPSTVGNVTNRHQIHDPNQTTFMPILCSRSSIKNVHNPNSKWHRKSNTEPSSPTTKFGCMGQINRTLNKISIGFPTTHRLISSTTTTAAAAAAANGGASTNNNVNVKYRKLKRIFTGQKQSSTNVENNGGDRIVQSCRDVRSNCRRGKKKNSRPPPAPVNVAEMDPPLPVNVAEMDPPLPVVKPIREEDSLWKRRSVGLELKSLEISG